MGLQTTFSGLLPLMQIELPGCTTQTILQYLRQAARKFCIDTEAWIEKLDAIDLTEDEVDYTLVVGYDAEVRRIVKAWIRTEEEVDDDAEGTQIDRDLFTFTPPSTFTLDDSLAPSEDVTDGLVVKVVLVPQLFEDVDSDETQAGISSTFLNYWAEPIMGYAKFALMKMKGKTWSNPAGAAEALMDYNTGVTMAKQEVYGFEYKDEQDGFEA